MFRCVFVILSSYFKDAILQLHICMRLLLYNLHKTIVIYLHTFSFYAVVHTADYVVKWVLPVRVCVFVGGVDSAIRTHSNWDRLMIPQEN